MCPSARLFSRLPAGLMALVLAGLLAGCGGGAAERVCPRVRLLPEAGRVTVLREGAEIPAPEDVVLHGRLDLVSGSCEIGGEEVAVAFDLAVAATRGPALFGTTAELGYFVSILSPEGEVLAHERFQAPLEFGADRRRAGVVDTLSQSFALEGEAPARAYRVLVGFELTPEQLRLNRR